ncbi:MAG TPA: zinc ABC transporter substrate-binding protein [Burkholderiaceae bacterium]|jgi:zinc/manganese transport system substrate-binding protein|nr:zinc ABC transporter substrate-binding protein [Burkholderiaceae bacterium]
MQTEPGRSVAQPNATGPAHGRGGARRALRRIAAAAALPLALLAAPSQAALHVLACEPEWGALAQALGGDLVDVTVATSALQDPHQIQAKPSLIARTRNADLIACTGAELEIGWLPVLLQQAGNDKVQPNQAGNFAAADYVRKLEVPSQVDRSMGDVHAAGNPHIQTDPRNIALVAAALGARLQQIDPAHASQYAQRLADFTHKWGEAIARWTAEAAPLKGVPVVSQHKAFAYLYDWLGMKEVAVLEPKPGVDPSVSHLEQVLGALKGTDVRMVLYGAYQDPRPSEWLSSHAAIPAVRLPFTVGGTDGAKDLYGLFDDTVARLLAAEGRK